MKTLVFLFIACFIYGNITVVYAHGMGLTVEAITPEGYKTYLDVNIPVPYQNEPTRLDFELWTSDGVPMEFTDMWVRIEKERATVFAGPIMRARFGLTGFTTTFPFEGEYDVFVRFQNGEKQLTETSFKISVTGEEAGVRKPIFSLLVSGTLGVSIGFLAMYFIKR